MMAVRPRDRRDSPGYRLLLIGGILCFAAVFGFWLLALAGVFSTPGQQGHHASNWLKQLAARRQLKFIRQSEVQDSFATLFHSEMMSKFGLHDWNDANAGKLLSALRQIEQAKIKTVLYSVSWEYAAPDDSSLRWAYLNNLAEMACKHTSLKVGFIVDMLRSPGWLFKKFPDCRAVDAGNRTYQHMSWFHSEANALALEMLRQVADNMAAKFPGCVVSMQPVYNNEYEAKFTQEYDSYQDYNPKALDTYRNWLRAKQPDLGVLNRRWSTSYQRWIEVKPPGLHAGSVMGIEEGARYWDWIRFREELGADVFNRACATIRAAGLKCFHHFPEFFSVIDAMYGAAMFKHIAASEHTDFIIMDSNFMTPYRTVMNPDKLRLYISAAHSYGKPVYFEAAVERYASYDLIQAGYKNAMLAGAPNLGITNWLGAVEMNGSLTEAMYASASACKATDVVGVFMHLESCSAFQGLQWHWAERDPLHNFVEGIAESLSSDCSVDVAVFVELDRFVANMHTFSKAVFIEPLVLYGSAELASYIAAKTALQSMPHDILALPTNSSKGLYLKVLQDL